MSNKQALVQLCVDHINNPERVAHFSKGKDVDTVIRAKFAEIIGTEHPTKKDLRRHQVAIYEILEEVIVETALKEVEENEFFMQFAETRNIARGDRNEFYIEDDAVLYVSEHSGTHWNISRQKLEGGTSFSVKTKAFAIAVYTDFELFMLGRVNFATLVAKVSDAIKRKVMEEVAASFAAGSAQLPAEFYQTGTYAESQLVKIYQHVQAATGTQPVIVGTQSALTQITAGLAVEWYSDGMKDTLNSTGRIGVYKGMTLVQLPQAHKANTFEFAYDDNQLLILPNAADKFVKIVFEGDDMIKEVSDNITNNDMSIEYKYITRFGTQTVFSSVFGLYKLA